MEKYNPKSKCPACGCHLVSTKYCGAAVALDALSRPAVMKRRCVACSYYWYEVPLNEGGEVTEKS